MTTPRPSRNSIPGGGAKAISFGMGWLPDPEERKKDDLTLESPQVRALLEKKCGLYKSGASAPLPPFVDLSPTCSAVENQGTTNSCSACATVGLFEYHQKRHFDNHIDLSVRFLYRAARKKEGTVGDNGVALSSTMDCVGTTGVAPDSAWPWIPDPSLAALNAEPPGPVQSRAADFQSRLQYRLDRPGVLPAQVLDDLRKHLASQYPCTFGFYLYASVKAAMDLSTDGIILAPSIAMVQGEQATGGHSVLAVGYDDKLGMLKIRNSYGSGWGVQGYGWLPYEYVTRRLARDFWSITDEKFKESEMYRS